MGRKIPPVVGDTPEETADYARVRLAREGGCTRPCGNQPDLPVCTKCFENLHAGRWTAGITFTFGHGKDWFERLENQSQVHGWIKPVGVHK